MNETSEMKVKEAMKTKRETKIMYKALLITCLLHLHLFLLLFLSPSSFSSLSSSLREESSILPAHI